jgi:hypothetical protein
LDRPFSQTAEAVPRRERESRTHVVQVDEARGRHPRAVIELDQQPEIKRHDGRVYTRGHEQQLDVVRIWRAAVTRARTRAGGLDELRFGRNQLLVIERAESRPAVGMRPNIR